jgi:hypothetical protein
MRSSSTTRLDLDRSGESLACPAAGRRSEPRRRRAETPRASRRRSATALVVDGLGLHRRDSQARVAFDPALGELFDDDVVELGAEGCDVAGLVRRPDQLEAVAHAALPKPGLDHEDELVERTRALVVRRDQEQHRPGPAVAALCDQQAQAVAELLHLCGSPGCLGVLGGGLESPTDSSRRLSRGRGSRTPAPVRGPARRAPPSRTTRTRRSRSGCLAFQRHARARSATTPHSHRTGCRSNWA